MNNNFYHETKELGIIQIDNNYLKIIGKIFL
jgi:hypothetical protein